MAERKTPFDSLPSIPFGKRPKVLVVGNGLNLSFKGAKKTDSIIRSEWKKHHGSNLPIRGDIYNPHPIWSLPFPLQVVVATNNHVQSCMSELAESFKKLDVTIEQRKLIDTILNVGFDAILSTNYSLEFEKSTIQNYTERKVYNRYKTISKQTTNQEQFGIYQCTELDDNNRTLLWHIHGTALRKESLVMGQLYYGKLLSEIIARSNEVNSKYRASLRYQSQFSPLSWIDYFLISDVYILGFKLDFSESDIWWLLDYKNRVFPETKVFFYDHSVNDEMKLMFDCYNIDTPDIMFNEYEKMNYVNYYKRICASIK